MDFTAYLNTIVKRQDLSQDQMAEMMEAIFSGQTTESQIGAFMAALATKGETFEELAGAARAMRTKAVRVQTLAKKVIDTCGTGGMPRGHLIFPPQRPLLLQAPV